MLVLYWICSVLGFNRRGRRMSVYSRWWKDTETLLFIFTFMSLANLQSVYSADDVHRGSDHSKTPQSGQYTLAEISVSYKNSKPKHFQGKYGLNSVIRDVKGIIVHAKSEPRDKSKSVNHDGCSPYRNKIPSVKWIALVERGNCNFEKKVKIATQEHNASAVVIYDDTAGDPIMNGGSKKSGVSIFMKHKDGLDIIKVLKGSSVMMHVVPGEKVPFNNPAENNISKTSVLFVSISFIVLMIISLAWLVFYYIQRFRYTHAKERLARRLACAAKKAIAKIPQSTVKSGDKVLEGDHDQCAVCIEQYKLHDVIRILPCTHVFHKSCVDPWLQENRSCPMCKMDILVAYGMQIGTSTESVHNNADPGAATQLVIEDPENSSSMEDAAAPAEVVLPFICLHNNRDEDCEESQQTRSQLLGAGPSSEDIRLSSTSLHSNKSGNGSGSISISSRVQKRDKEASNNIEMKALIEKAWSHDEEDDEHIVDRSKEKEQCNSERESCEHSCSASPKSLRTKDDDSKKTLSTSADSRSNKDNTSIIILDTGGGDSIGAVEFHQEQDLSPSNSFSEA